MLSREDYIRIERELREPRNLADTLILTLPVWELLYWEISKAERASAKELEIDVSLVKKLLGKIIVDEDNQERIFS